MNRMIFCKDPINLQVVEKRVLLAWLVIIPGEFFVPF
jgi:hypothetical protein